MGQKRQLNWRGYDQGGRWRKMYRGKYFQRQKRHDETKEESYRRCLSEFEAWKEQVDAELGEPDPSRAAWRKMITNATGIMTALESSDTAENRRAWKMLYRTRALCEIMLAQGRPFPFGEVPQGMNLDDDEVVIEFSIPEETYLSRTQAPWAKTRQKTANPDCVRAVCDRFLSEKKSEADAGEISQSRYSTISDRVNAFVAWLGASKPTKAIGNGALAQYRKQLLEDLNERRYKARTAKDKMQVALQFTRWCVSEQLIERPPILDSPDRLKISAPPPPIVTFDDDELSLICNEVNERMRAFILLCLNCGMTQSDIGQLRQDEVDWKAGRIVRQRTKTRKHHGGSVPTVDYKLWPETFRLLKKFRSEDEALALRSESGKPLWVDGSSTKPIDLAWKRFAKRVGEQWPAKPMKSLRKTSATRLESNSEHARFVDLFLGHAAGSVKAQHYASYDAVGFDAAVLWLGQQWPKLTGASQM